MPSENEPQTPIRSSVVQPWIAATLLAAIYSTVAIIRLRTGRATYWDFGYYRQVLWLIGQGHWAARSAPLGPPAVTVAGSWILYPVGWISPWLGSAGLLILQSAALASGMLFLGWWMARYSLPWKLRWAIWILYSVYPTILGSALFDWHPDTLAIPAFFYAAWAVETRHVRQFWVAVLLMLLTKTTAGLVVIGLAGPWAMRRQWRTALISIAVGLAVGLGEVLWLFPLITGHQMALWQPFYGWISPSPGGGVLQLLTHPQIIARTLMHTRSLFNFFVLTAGVGFLPAVWTFFEGGWAWPVWIVMIFNVLSSFSHQSNPFTQYALPVAPFLFIGLVIVAAHFPRGPATAILPWILAAFCLASWFYFAKPVTWYARTPETALKSVSQLIPPSAPLYGQNSTLAPLATRNDLYLLPLPKTASIRPGTYVLLDERVNPINQVTAPAVVLGTIRRLQDSPSQWQELRHRGPVWLFRRI